MAQIIRKEKKKYYPIIAPPVFDKQEIGEIPLYDLNECIGRTLSLNLITLINDPKKQNVNIKFEITNIDGQKALTEVIGYHIVQSSVRRMIKRKKIRIDDSFAVKTNDSKSVRIKPFLITAGFIRRSALRGLRENLRDIITKDVSKMSYEDLIVGLISRKFQNELRSRLNKIYPLAVCEIRAMEIEKEKKGATEQKKKKKERKGEPKKVKEAEEEKVKEEKETKKEDKEKAEEKNL